LSEHNKRQGVVHSAITYSHPLAEPSNHKWGHQHGLTQIPETRPEKSKEKHELIFTDSASSHILRRQLHVSHARGEAVHADIHAAARRTVLEAIASRLREELAAAMARAQTMQEQLQNQTMLALSKDHIIQSIAEESRVAQTELKGAEDKIVHLRIELRLEHVRRLRDRDKLLDQQAMMRDCHEAEIRRIAQEARSVQEKLATLHDLQSRIHTGQYSSIYDVHLPRAPSSMAEAAYTGECPTSPRGILHTDTYQLARPLILLHPAPSNRHRIPPNTIGEILRPSKMIIGFKSPPVSIKYLTSRRRT
jgi:hypothetical protein